MQYHGRVAEMIITSPQPSSLWHLCQAGNRLGQSRAPHPYNAAERTRYSSKQPLKSWEPDHSFPFHSQMRSNIKDKHTSKRCLIFYTFKCYFFYVLCFSAKQGFCPYHML